MSSFAKRYPALEYVSVTALRPYDRNARTHSRKQIRQIADGIRTFGFTNLILIDSQNVILAGHGRAKAAAHLGMTKVPCVRIETMTPEQKRAYVLADNKLAMNAGWDEELLAEELKGLLEIDLDFDIAVTGFSIPEIDSLIDGLAPEEPGNPEEDQVSPIPNGPSVACHGDLWALGLHRLVCGSALERETFLALMADEEALMDDEWLKTAIEYKTNWEEALERRKRQGLTRPEPIRHPDDIIIDTFTSEVTFKGPLTKEQKEAQDQLVAMRPEIEKSIHSVNRRLAKNPNDADDLRTLRDLRQLLLQIMEVEQMVKRRASKA